MPGAMPAVEKNYWRLPSGPAWAWWILTILPLDTQQAQVKTICLIFCLCQTFVWTYFFRTIQYAIMKNYFSNKFWAKPSWRNRSHPRIPHLSLQALAQRRLQASRPACQGVRRGLRPALSHLRHDCLVISSCEEVSPVRPSSEEAVATDVPLPQPAQYLCPGLHGGPGQGWGEADDKWA